MSDCSQSARYRSPVRPSAICLPSRAVAKPSTRDKVVQAGQCVLPSSLLCGRAASRSVSGERRSHSTGLPSRFFCQLWTRISLRSRSRDRLAVGAISDKCQGRVLCGVRGLHYLFGVKGKVEDPRLAAEGGGRKWEKERPAQGPHTADGREADTRQVHDRLCWVEQILATSQVKPACPEPRCRQDCLLKSWGSLALQSFDRVPERGPHGTRDLLAYFRLAST